MLLSTEYKLLELCVEEAPDEAYEPAEAAAYVRKMIHNAKVNDMTDSLPYSDADLEELFRSNLTGFPEGITAASVFVDILSQYIADTTPNTGVGEAPFIPDTDPNSYYTVVKDMLSFYVHDEALIRDCCVTVNKLLKIFFRRPAIDKEFASFWSGNCEMLHSRFGRVYALLARCFGQDIAPEDFWQSATGIRLASNEIAVVSEDISMEATVIYEFYALLILYYSETEPEKHKHLLDKCNIIFVDIMDHLEKKTASFCETFGQTPPVPEAELYRCTADILGYLVRNRHIGSGLFQRLRYLGFN